MAENESLDLSQPGGQRWKHLLDAVRKKKSPADIARQVELKLPQVLRKAVKEFVECGVPFDEFMKCRDDSKELKKLVRKCEGHEFANLFEQTAAISRYRDQWFQVVRQAESKGYSWTKMLAPVGSNLKGVRRASA